MPGSPTTSASCPSPLAARAPAQKVELLLAPDQRSERAGAEAPAAARAHDPVERDRRQCAFELVRPAILDDEKTGDLPLHVCGDEDRAGVGGALDARGYIGRVPEHFPARLHDDRPRLETDTRRELRHALGRVPRVDVG
jgi:hypothetical protein